jgi:DNA polymerase
MPAGRLDADIAAKSTRGQRLEVIAAAVRRCRLCDLYRNRTHAVPGEGRAPARLMIVGEGPGSQEDASGTPFVGQAGKRLDTLLLEAGLERRSIFVTNIVKCRPASRLDAKMRNRRPRMGEITACSRYLVRQIDLVRPEIILCLGMSAAKGVLGSDFDLTRQRGKWFDGPSGSRVMASFHPAYLNRWANADAVLRTVRRDFSRVKSALD